MPSIKLTYFGIKGRAELSRLILAAAEMPYEDNRVTNEQWAVLKPSEYQLKLLDGKHTAYNLTCHFSSFIPATPFGSLPILEYDGEELAQSITVARFLAKKCGLGGRNELESAQADMVVDHAGDALQSEFESIN